MADRKRGPQRHRSADQVAAALASSFAAWLGIASHALVPTQRKIALRCAGECLWALGLDEYKGVQACPPAAYTIDLEAIVGGAS